MTFGRISEDFPEGEHIALTCVNHQDKRWSTKNIDFIGARHLFYNLDNVADMGPECPCPMSDLRPLTLEEALADLEVAVDLVDQVGSAEWKAARDR